MSHAASTCRLAPDPQAPACAPQALRLPDGRRLSYMRAGALDGPAVVFLHGLPGSRLQCLHVAEPAARAGLRLVIPERPGFGRSDPQPNRSWLDWGDDVAALADHLGLRRFTVCGWSGGAPFAAACAYALPDRVRRLVIVSGVTPLDMRENWTGMPMLNRFLLNWAAYLPSLLAYPVTLVAAAALRWPDWRLDMLARQLSASDRALMRDPGLRDLMIADLTESLCRGNAGLESELCLLTQPLNFDLADIRVPTTVLHGDADRIAPAAMGAHYAERVSAAQLRLLPGEGHFMAYRHWDEVLAACADRRAHDTAAPPPPSPRP